MLGADFKHIFALDFTNTRPAINDKNTLMGLNSIYDFFKNNE